MALPGWKQWSWKKVSKFRLKDLLIGQGWGGGANSLLLTRKKYFR